jgi:TPR repeat protein
MEREKPARLWNRALIGMLAVTVCVLGGCSSAPEETASQTEAPKQSAPVEQPKPAVDPVQQKIAELLPKAEQGSVPAQVELAQNYEKLNPSNKDEAVKWYKKAATKGDPVAQANLGCYYQVGQGGVQQNDNEAMKLFRASAAKGCPDGEFQLAEAYNTGWGDVEPKPAEAVKWYKKAIAHKSTDALTALAMLYTDGRGVPQSDKKAAELFQQAAQRGDATAQYNLARCYLKGKGVPKDPNQGFSWCKKSAEKFSLADELMGRMYEKGWGVTADKDQAIAWYTKAAASGDQKAKERLEALKTGVEPIKPSGDLGFTLPYFKDLFAKATKRGGLNLKITKCDVKDMDDFQAFGVTFNDGTFLQGAADSESGNITGLTLAGDGPPFKDIMATLIGCSVVPDPDASKYMQVLSNFAQEGDPQIYEGQTDLNGLQYTMRNMGNGYIFTIQDKAREAAESAAANKENGTSDNQ